MLTRLTTWFARLDPYLLLLLFLSLFALTPLTAPGYFYEAHDGRHSVFYLQMFDASLRSGAFWPRWAMHHIQGYGYPTFMIQAPLSFYIGEIFVLLGAGITLAAKLTWLGGFLAGAWGVYRLVRYWIEDAVQQTGFLPETRFVSRLRCGLLSMATQIIIATVLAIVRSTIISPSSKWRVLSLATI